MRSFLPNRSMTPITAIAPAAMTQNGISRLNPPSWTARLIAITTITRNNAASAPAMGAGSTRGVESAPFMDALSTIGISPPIFAQNLIRNPYVRPQMRSNANLSGIIRLLNLGSRNFYHIGPFFDVFAQVSVKFLRSLHQRNRPLLEPCCLYLRQIDDLVDGSIEESNDFLRSILRRHDTKPNRRLVAGHGFSYRRQIGCELRSRKAGRAECANLPPFS